MAPQTGNVEEGLIDRQALDQWGEAAQHIEHLTGHLAVQAVRRRDVPGPRTATPRFDALFVSVMRGIPFGSD